MTDLKHLSDTTETSIEIFRAIAERVGNSEAEIMAQWQEPTDRDAIIARAKELAPGEELFWGAEGQVA
ncbi:MAG: hypothetical protein VYB54_04710 [Pseudomonadota bacterium]|nr:hypothetical protein [Pseudomonadota bacterium]